MKPVRGSASAFGVHGVTWCGLLAVLGLFVWLNLDWSRDAYVHREASGWRGGVRQGFPMHCRDAGNETTVTVSAEGLLLHFRPYGGWHWPGLAADLAVFALAAATTLLLTERGMRAYSRRRKLLLLTAEPPLAVAITPLPPSRTSD